MRFRILTAALLASAAPIAAFADGHETTLRWARAAEALTLDPHAQNEGPTTTFNHQIYEPLIVRNMEGAMEGGLATDWAPSSDDPNVWVFNLRDGVSFHGGESFDSADVVFSMNRAMSENSNFRELLSSVVEVRAAGPLTVEIETAGPNPLLPNNLTNIFIMDEGWSTENGAAEVQDFAGGEDTFSSRNANGTGPYILESRSADERSVFVANPEYWGIGEFPLAADRIEFTPIQNPATRVAALLSGEVDFIQDVPVQDLQPRRQRRKRRGSASPPPQNRVIFFRHRMSATEDLEQRQRRRRQPAGRCARAQGHVDGDQPRCHPAGRDASAILRTRRGHDCAPLR